MWSIRIQGGSEGGFICKTGPCRSLVFWPLAHPDGEELSVQGSPQLWEQGVLGQDRSLILLVYSFEQLSTPPACHTQNPLQLRHHQPLAWRVCHPRAPVTLPMQSLWSRLPYPRAPRILLCTCLVLLAHLGNLGTMSSPQPTLPCHPLGS